MILKLDLIYSKKQAEGLSHQHLLLLVSEQKRRLRVHAPVVYLGLASQVFFCCKAAASETLYRAV